MTRTVFAYLAIALAALLAAGPAATVEPGHYGPGDGSGTGVFINCNNANECSVFWFNHLAAGDNVWLMGVPNCERGPDEVCDISLTTPSAPFWMGRAGELEIGDPVGTLALTPMANGQLAIEWEVVGLEHCRDLTPGGLIFQKCIGTQMLGLIAGNPSAAPPD